MTHRSRLGGISIDCRPEDISGAAAFWSAALGLPVVEPRGHYVKLTPEHGMSVEVQAVEHDPRVHIDIETDDKEAERERLEALGAEVVARIEDWIVMQAPTGHRFCLVPPETGSGHRMTPVSGQGETT